MKTLILYATKYGAAREIAQGIANNMGNCIIHDLKQKDMPDLVEFDCVILGSSLYAGTIRKEAKEFLSQNASNLQGKKLGLFLSGMDPSQESTYWDSNFPSEILQMATTKSYLGGIFDPKKAKAAERILFKLASKQSGYVNTIDNSKIQAFAKRL